VGSGHPNVVAAEPAFVILSLADLQWPMRICAAVWASAFFARSRHDSPGGGGGISSLFDLRTIYITENDAMIGDGVSGRSAVSGAMMVGFWNL